MKVQQARAKDVADEGAGTGLVGPDQRRRGGSTNHQQRLTCWRHTYDVARCSKVSARAKVRRRAPGKHSDSLYSLPQIASAHGIESW